MYIQVICSKISAQYLDVLICADQGRVFAQMLGGIYRSGTVDGGYYNVGYSKKSIRLLTFPA
jgi:hypothetical protein